MLGLLLLAQALQRHPQQVVQRGLKIDQREGFHRAVDGPFVAAGLEVDARPECEGFPVVRVGAAHAFEQFQSAVEFLQRREALGQEQAQSERLAASLGQLRQQRAGLFLAPGGARLARCQAAAVEQALQNEPGGLLGQLTPLEHLAPVPWFLAPAELAVGLLLAPPLQLFGCAGRELRAGLVEIVEQLLAALAILGMQQAGRQRRVVAAVLAIARNQLAQHRRRQVGTAGIGVRPRQVVALLGEALFDSVAPVRGALLAGRRDIAQSHQLLERLGRSRAVVLFLCGVAAGIAFHRVPALDLLYRPAILKRVDQHLAVHIQSGREAEHVQGGGRGIQYAGAVDVAAGAHARRAQAEDAERAMLHGGPGGFGGNVVRQQAVGVEAVVAEQHHRAIGAGQCDQASQHDVVIAVPFSTMPANSAGSVPGPEGTSFMGLPAW